MIDRTDAELVEGTREGDREAYGILVTRYQGHVYGLAYSLAGKWEDAQDIAQETFIRAYINLDQLREPGRFAAWLRRVTFGVAVNWLKAYRPGLFEKLDGRVDLDSLEIPDFQPEPVEIVEKQELAQAVQRAIASLPPKYRVPLTMFHLDGLSYQKVADFLDIPLGTAKSLISRARSQLKTALGNYYGEELTPMVQEVFKEHKLTPEFARKVLENVPKLGWGIQKECTFAGALEAALAVTEHPYSYAQIMGYSGLAFRTRWYQGDIGQRWCPSSPVGEFPEEVQSVEKATGWRLRIADDLRNPQPPKDLYKPAITAAINSGKPVLGYEAGLNMCVIYGYEENGSKLLMRDYFSEGPTCRDLAAEVPAFFIFIEDRQPPLSPLQAFAHGCQMAINNWQREPVPIHFQEHRGKYWLGEDALQRWADDIGLADSLAQSECDLLFFVSWWNFDALTDARIAGLQFLKEHQELLTGDACTALARAIQRCQEEVNLLSAAFYSGEVFTGPWTGKTIADWDAKTRAREQQILSEAKAVEAEAVTALQQVLALC